MSEIWYLTSTYRRVYIHARKSMYAKHACMHACMHACVHDACIACMHSMHTYIHACKCMYVVHTIMQSQLAFKCAYVCINKYSPMGEGPGAEGREAGWWGRCRREYRGDRIGTKPMGCPWARTRVLAFGCRMHPTKMHLEPDASWTRMHTMQYAIIPEYAIMLSNFAVTLL